MRPRGLSGLFLLAAVLLFVLPSAIRYYTDWLWFQEVGYTAVFLRTLNVQAAVFAVTFAVVAVFLYGNLRIARSRASSRPRVVLGTGGDGRPITVDGQQVAGMAVPVAVVVAGLIALVSASQWL